MKKASFLVTDGIPGIAAEGEIIKVSDEGIVIGRWLSISKYPKLMASRDSLRSASSCGVWISKRITLLSYYGAPAYRPDTDVDPEGARNAIGELGRGAEVAPPPR